MTNKYLDAPIHILDSINRYVEHRLSPGGFVTAVLSNDLTGAFNQADTDSEAGIRDILKYVRWEIPAESWGSPAKVEAWLNSKPRQNHSRRDVSSHIKQCRQQWKRYNLLFDEQLVHPAQTQVTFSSKLRKNQMTNETKNIVVEKITEFIKEYGAYCVLANAYNPDSRIANQKTYERIQGEADEVLAKISAAILSAISNKEKSDD